MIRHEAVARRTLPQLIVETEEFSRPGSPDALGDDRLRLIFTCCHPALSAEARIALTLRLVCGMTTTEIARCLLVSTSTMAARITRAKKKIAIAHIPYRVPSPQDLPQRLDTVLDVIHLVLTAGHTAVAGANLMRPELTRRAEDLARLLRSLIPEAREAIGLLALVLLTRAREPERVGQDGMLRLLAEQNRARWDADAIREGTRLAHEALEGGGRPGKYALLAAINALHDEAPTFESTDWSQIVGLYDHLQRAWPSPVVSLNRAAAIRYAHDPAAALTALERVATDPRLAGYPYLAASRADFLRELGRTDEARPLYEEALAFTGNEIERSFLIDRLRHLPT